MIRWVGRTLLTAGAVLGAAVGAAVLLHVNIPLPWLAAVGLAKLTLAASGGLMAGGAVCLRIARRREQRLLEGPRSPSAP